MKKYKVIAVLCCISFIVVVALALYHNELTSKPRLLGAFETKDAETSVVSAGGCTVFITKFKQGEQGNRENFYFSCPRP